MDDELILSVNTHGSLFYKPYLSGRFFSIAKNL